MTTQPQLADEKKLTVVYRIEPGCLGPTGKDHVERFCTFAGNALKSVDTGFINWEIVPRHDKSLPELQYLIANKKLDLEKTGKYLQLLDRNLADFEYALHEKISILIDQFPGRQS